jgi:hypothetical protein
MPKPSFSAGERDKSIEFCSGEDNLRSKGLIMTLDLEMWWAADAKWGSAGTMRGVATSAEIKLGNGGRELIVDVIGLWLAEAELPRLCSLPWLDGCLVAANAP